MAMQPGNITMINGQWNLHRFPVGESLISRFEIAPNLCYTPWKLNHLLWKMAPMIDLFNMVIFQLANCDITRGGYVWGSTNSKP